MLDNFNTIWDDLDDLEHSLEDSYLEELSYELNTSELLIPNYRNNGFIGCFNDDLWVFNDDLTKTYNLINFQELEKFRFLNLKQKDVTRIKLYIAYILIDEELEPSTVIGYYDDIEKFLKVTDCMDEEHLNSLNQIIMDEVNRYESGNTFSHTAFNYLNFLIEKLQIQDPIYSSYRSHLKRINSKVKRKSRSRTLPSSKDIMLLNYYIDKFFNDSSIDKELRLFYKPILLWWKLTNIIPMRPSEFSVKLERNCIFEDNGNYFLKINRIKEKHASNFPLLKKIQVNEDIAKLILRYIDETKPFGDTETLFSFRATHKLRKILRQRGYKVGVTSGKLNENYFTRMSFYTLLDSFYSIVIKGMYDEESYNRQIRAGDTRHFAFFSLLMQGVSPVEIALLGGHSTLEMQVNYQNCIEYYIGTELYDFLNGKKDEALDKTYKKLNDVINSLPSICPKPLHKRRPLDVGYCLCDFSVDTCDNVDDFCCFCSKWWGEPIRLTYDKLRLQIENEIKKLDKNTFIKLSALEELLSRNYNLRYKKQNMDSYTETKSTINEIKSACDKIVGLKISLIADDFINNISCAQSSKGDILNG